ncbi:hypothetical protein BDV18DRAFT_138372 [Aspergillus unguis]
MTSTSALLRGAMLPLTLRQQLNPAKHSPMQRWPAGLASTRFAEVTCMATWSTTTQLLFQPGAM